MKTSFSGKIWNFYQPDENLITELTKQANISELVARVLVNRGFENHLEISSLLNTKLKNTIPDPSLLLDMDKGVQRVVEAIANKQQITIFGDYDVDGVTSSCLMIKYLRSIGISPKFYLPNRFTNGYGLSDSAIEMMLEWGTELLIVVDSGIASIKEVETAKELGIETIVIDHHAQTSEEIPNAVAVINPNRLDQEEIGNSHIKHLSAAGVVFLFLIALQRELRVSGFFKDSSEPDLTELTDIASLGTLCDIMELKGINRALVKFALSKTKYSTGIDSLMSSFNIQKISSSEDFSFFIGPAINSAGRIGDPHIALQLFLEESTEKSKGIATELLKLNQKRKRIEKQVSADAMKIISENNLKNNPGICVFDNDWNEGVIGIVAGKLKDKFQKPVFVVTFDQDGFGKGSTRSVKGIHIGEFLEKARKLGLITKGGGHELAGGFSMERSKIHDFIQFVNTEIKGEFVNSINVDYSISSMSNLDSIYKDISIVEPFGKGVEKPIFCLARARIKYLKQTSSGTHLMFNFSSEFDDGNIKAILFNSSSKQEIVKLIEDNKFELFDIVGTINYNEQFGSSIIIDDIRLSL